MCECSDYDPPEFMRQQSVKARKRRVAVKEVQ
jgi:hypothetical protein